MTIKSIQRNIPPERENSSDRFRVQFKDKKDFDKLVVKVVRLANGEQQSFEFPSASLPDRDSIHFSTSVVDNKLCVEWHNIQPSIVLIDIEDNGINSLKKTAIKSRDAVGKTAFPPIADKHSRILILGTMPGERSLALQQYYGHAGNHFWKIMFALFNRPFSKDYVDRKQLLLDNKVALWDVLEYCESIGSADSAIANEKANDFKSFYNEHPLITHVFFSSKKAEAFYYQYIGKKESIVYNVLPSPSSANTWKTYEDKLHDWKSILKHL